MYMVFKRAENKSTFKRKIRGIFQGLHLWKILFFFLLSLFLFCFIYAYYILNLNTIYPDIFIDGIDVGGLKREEAVGILNENLDKTYQSDYLMLSVPDMHFKIHFSDIDYLPDYEKAVELAFNTGRRGNVIERLREIWKVRKNHLFITSQMCYNIEKTTGILENIRIKTYKEPQNAQINIVNGKVEIRPHVAGFSVDVKKSLIRIDNFLINRVWEDVELCYEEILPKVTTQMVEDITYKLGEFATVFNPENEARVHNIKTACNKINQTLLLPEEEFSMDKTLGDRTEQNGYKRAKVIVNNELVDGLGGGICQVTSTIYNSVLLSGLEVLERRNHTLPSTYVELGRDATISQGYIDFRFKNTSGYTVLIEAKTVGNRVIVTIWGREPEIKTYAKIRTKVVQVIEPDGVEEIIDYSLKSGETVVEREAQPGYKVEVYRDTFDMNGKLIKTEKISVDTYQPKKRKIRVGAGGS